MARPRCGSTRHDAQRIACADERRRRHRMARPCHQRAPFRSARRRTRRLPRHRRTQRCRVHPAAAKATGNATCRNWRGADWPRSALPKSATAPPAPMPKSSASSPTVATCSTGASPRPAASRPSSGGSHEYIGLDRGFPVVWRRRRRAGREPVPAGSGKSTQPRAATARCVRDWRIAGGGTARPVARGRRTRGPWSLQRSGCGAAGWHRAVLHPREARHLAALPRGRLRNAYAGP